MAALFAKVAEQVPRRAKHGERSFSLHVDDNARNVCYVLLEWESLPSAHRFLQAPVSQDLVAEWPIEKVLGAIPLYDLGEQLAAIKQEKRRDA